MTWNSSQFSSFSFSSLNETPWIRFLQIHHVPKTLVRPNPLHPWPLVRIEFLYRPFARVLVCLYFSFWTLSMTLDQLVSVLDQICSITQEELSIWLRVILPTPWLYFQACRSSDAMPRRMLNYLRVPFRSSWFFVWSVSLFLCITTLVCQVERLAPWFPHDAAG